MLLRLSWIKKSGNNFIEIGYFFKRFKSSLRIGILGIPFSRGQPNEGVEKGPEALRRAGIVKELEHLGHNVRDFGDLCYSSDAVVDERYEIVQKIQSLPHLALCSQKVSAKVQEILESSLLLAIGGDHSIALGSVDGHAKARNNNVSVIWVDAHADLNTADTSPSGNVHGMVVSLLVRDLSDYWPYLPDFEWQDPVISIKNLAYIGLRSVDLHERVLIEKYKVAAFGMDDIDRFGITNITQLALRKIDPYGDRSLHLSFDIDSLDSLEAPSTGTPVRGGLTLREALNLVEEVYNTGRLTAVDIVEINPTIGTAADVKTTLDAAVQVVKAAFAYSRAGNIPEKFKRTLIPNHILGVIKGDN